MFRLHVPFAQSSRARSAFFVQFLCFVRIIQKIEVGVLIARRKKDIPYAEWHSDCWISRRKALPIELASPGRMGDSRDFKTTDSAL